MRAPQIRVRTLMLAVGGATLLMWGGLMGWRSFVYSRLAADYSRYEREWRETGERDRKIPGRSRSVSAVWGREIAAFYAPLAEKYRRAAWRPWDSVAPDPPAPVFGAAPR
ncbi:MAG: hypothetical protein U0835_04965 [Isosphaeraceae bacterium]